MSERKRGSRRGLAESDVDLVDFFAQVLFTVAATGYDAGRDGDPPSQIVPPESFELHSGWPPVNRREWRTFTRTVLQELESLRRKKREESATNLIVAKRQS